MATELEKIFYPGNVASRLAGNLEIEESKYIPGEKWHQNPLRPAVAPPAPYPFPGDDPSEDDLGCRGF